MPYSVSPRRHDFTVGPNPTMNCGTRMPKRRAHVKWPNSWKPMENSRPTAKATIPRTVRRVLSSASGQSAPVRRRGRCPGDGGAGVLAGPPLRGQDVVHARRDAEVRRLVEGTRDDLQNGWEREATRQESADGLLVGRVEQGGEDATGLPRLPGQPHRRERLLVERRELPGAGRGPV